LGKNFSPTPFSFYFPPQI